MKQRQSADRSIQPSVQGQGASTDSANPQLAASNSDALDAMQSAPAVTPPSPVLIASGGAGLDEEGSTSEEGGAEFGESGQATAAPSDGDGGDDHTKEVLALVREYAEKLGLSALPTLSMGAEADAKTEAISATGLYEAGTIYLNPNTFDPSSKEGRQTLAHELTHAAQDLNAFDGLGSGAAAEVEAHTLGADLASGKTVEAPSAFLPEDHVAAEGASTHLTDMVHSLSQKMEPLESATEAAKDRLGARAVEGDRPEKDTKRRAKDWRKGSKRTMKGALKTRPGKDMIKKVGKGEPHGAELGGVKRTEEYGDLIDMYKATIEDEEDGPALQALWESKIANTGFRRRTKQTSRIIADEVKKEAKLSADEEAAAAEAREAAAMTVVPPDVIEGGGEASAPPDPSSISGADGQLGTPDLSATSVDPTPMATPNFDAIKALDNGARPTQDTVVGSMAMQSTVAEEMETQGPEIGNRYLYTLGEIGSGILDGGAKGLKKGAIKGLKKETVDKLTGKLEESIDGALNDKLGKHLKTDGFEFVQAGKAGFDLFSSMYEHGSLAGPLINMHDAVLKKGEKAGASYNTLMKNFSDENMKAWQNGSTSDKIGMTLAIMGDALGFAIDFLGVATEALSQIGNLLWGVGFSLIIIGLILLFWTGGASAALIKGGKAVIKFAKLLAKFEKVLKKVSTAMKPFKFLFDTAAAFMVPDFMLADQTEKSKAGASEIAEATTEAVASKATSDATKAAKKGSKNLYDKAKNAGKKSAEDGKQEAIDKVNDAITKAGEGDAKVRDADGNAQTKPGEGEQASPETPKKSLRERAADLGKGAASYSKDLAAEGGKELKSQLSIVKYRDVVTEARTFREELRAFAHPEDAVKRRQELSGNCKDLEGELKSLKTDIDTAKAELKAFQDEVNGVSGPGSTGDGSAWQHARAEVNLRDAQERLDQLEKLEKTKSAEKKMLESRIKSIDEYYVQEIADRDRMGEIHQENIDFAKSQMEGVHEADEVGFEEAKARYEAVKNESAWSSSFLERKANPEEFTQKENKSSGAFKKAPDAVVGWFSGSSEDKEEEGEGEAQLDEGSKKGYDTAGNEADDSLEGVREIQTMLQIESPIEDVDDLDELYDQAAEHIEAFHNEHAAAFHAYASEQIIAGEIEENRALEESVIEPAKGTISDLSAPINEAQSNASQRASLMGSASAPTEDADPELAQGTKESMSRMEEGKDDMSKTPDSGDVSGGAEAAGEAQNVTNEMATEGAEEGKEASSEQVEIMDTVGSTRDEAEQQVVNSESALIGKISEDEARLAEVRSIKADHLAKMQSHHSQGESAAASYGSKLASGADWAATLEEFRE
ncbi:MAG: DUF4157 domain-containing protein [Deltaproteobacteria bacterium]|nr:MAG: DUF4157 domain-containing protein [Deltaproteobacteria bacterium]